MNKHDELTTVKLLISGCIVILSIVVVLLLRQRVSPQSSIQVEKQTQKQTSLPHYSKILEKIRSAQAKIQHKQRQETSHKQTLYLKQMDKIVKGLAKKIDYLEQGIEKNLKDYTLMQKDTKKADEVLVVVQEAIEKQQTIVKEIEELLKQQCMENEEIAELPQELQDELHLSSQISSDDSEISEDDDEEMKKLIMFAGAALCYFNPQLYPALSLIFSCCQIEDDILHRAKTLREEAVNSESQEIFSELGEGFNVPEAQISHRRDDSQQEFSQNHSKKTAKIHKQSNTTIFTKIRKDIDNDESLEKITCHLEQRSNGKPCFSSRAQRKAFKEALGDDFDLYFSDIKVLGE